MELNSSLDFLEKAKTLCSAVCLVVYERLADTNWESSVFEHIPIHEVSLEAFKKSLIEISNSILARDILTTLLHQDLAYSVEIMPIEEASLFAEKFCFLFSDQAIYYSNSTWNNKEYTNSAGDFELGLSSWASLTAATFDSGIIICDSDKIGIAWFQAED
ncbi:hypothetical protein [Hymenobacter bucti]|uniref:Uncharacterized protein n=1 Tax=Hymenobacter bucti TaxID=1844114 RepID=A0ABW4QYI4_9BACT